ncbi:hypothetical protein C0Q70_13444 [Pomacea canaliculata]|uniref:Uncharacterized protein n=1 Tax=Pomacea canaliculata TaxID=400727 RepID=A0A2T7NX93_POMCA|nr:hypothetical protein C0Q70_13444 [Pomacea canaliculata]
MAEKGEQQQPQQQQQQQARRESPAVAFRSSQHLATAVAELDPFRVSEQPEQVGGAEGQRCADSTVVRASTHASVADQRVSDGGVTDCVGLVSADLSHGPFPQAVEQFHLCDFGERWIPTAEYSTSESQGSDDLLRLTRKDDKIADDARD